jgi:alpha-tubulin suppressor-like RCC1 family protein
MSHRSLPARLVPLFLTQAVACNALLDINEASVGDADAAGGAAGSSVEGAGGDGGSGGAPAGPAGQGGRAGAGGAPLAAPAVAAGGDHTCAWVEGGTVQCWGDGSFGQTGSATAATSERPLTVLAPGGAPLAEVRRVALGSRHGCAIVGEAGRVLCWGDNGSGQSGAPPLDVAQTPVPVAVRDAQNVELSGVRQIALGDAHGCALLASGSIACWGNNDFGQLGSPGPSTPTARLVVDAASNALADAREVASGDFFACAITASGRVACWGQNNFGQLGFGGPPDANSATFVPFTVDAAGTPLRGVAHLALGGFHGCVVNKDGFVRCWGADDAGQLGTLADAGGPAGAGGAPTPTPPAFAPGDRATPGAHPVPLAVVTPEGKELGGALALALGGRHGCVVTGGGGRCWGLNDAGQLGDGTAADGLGARPLKPPGGGPANGEPLALGLGARHGCAAALGQVFCWGSNAKGQLGRAENVGTETPTPVPSPVEGLQFAP